MQVNIRSLGNSKGILIPKPILEQTGLQDVAELRVNNGVIEIRPVKTNPREGWALDSQRIALDKDDSLVWPEFGNADDKDLKRERLPSWRLAKFGWFNSTLQLAVKFKKPDPVF